MTDSGHADEYTRQKSNERDQVMLSYKRYPDLDFTCFVSEGETPIENWLQTVCNCGAEGMTTRELYDLTRQTNLFSNEAVAMILERTMKDQALRPPDGKTAVVVDQTSKFGISRMYELQAEVAGASAKTQIFY